MNSATSDSENPNDEVRYHLGVGPADLTDVVSLPGNLECADKVTALWDDHGEKASHREYRTVTDSYDGTPIPVTPTGIGSPSTAIAMEELARVGTDAFIRVGSYDAAQPEMDVGGLVITPGAVRQEGTSKGYVRENYPAITGHEVVSVPVAAVERLSCDYHVGLTVSADSFYAGQSRPGFRGFRAAGPDSLIEELRKTNMKNIEMEVVTLLTIVNVHGLHVGAVCSVYANRVTDEPRTGGESRAAETASPTVHLLAKMDEIRREADVDRWHVGLSLD